MTKPAKPLHSRRTARSATKPVEPAVDTPRRDTAISPQEFYREMVDRADVRRILSRLAQIENQGS